MAASNTPHGDGVLFFDGLRQLASALGDARACGERGCARADLVLAVRHTQRVLYLLLSAGFI